MFRFSARIVFGVFQNSNHRILCKNIRLPKTLKHCFIFSAAAYSLTKDDKKSVKNDGEERSYQDMIRQSAVECCTTASRLLTLTVSQLIHLEGLYCEEIDKLILLTEMSLQVGTESAQADTLWDVILQSRSQLNAIKDSKKDLEMLLNSVQQMLNSAAEAAYSTGADYAGMAAAQHLHSSLSCLEQARTKTREKQKEFNTIQARAIDKMAKKEKKKDRDKSDTKGSSPHNVQTLEEARKFLNQHQPTESYHMPMWNQTVPKTGPSEDVSVIHLKQEKEVEREDLHEVINEPPAKRDVSSKATASSLTFPTMKELQIKSVEEDENSITIKFEEE